MDLEIYLDGILVKDIPGGLDDFKAKVIRESGYANTEQILRDDTDIKLTFYGDGFRYICEQRKENYCEEILCTIVSNCNDDVKTIYEGFILQSNVEVLLRKCIVNITKLKDNSFSALIRDWLGTEVELFNTRTLNCFPLSLPDIYINTPTTPNTYTVTDIRVFDVFDVFKYLVAYFTDNRVTVKSDFLTNNNNRYAITTGYNMHNSIYNIAKSFPKISIETLFKELRKKLVLYMAVEFEEDGTPYLRIENEDYFYGDDILLEIPELPLDAIEKIDEDRLFNNLKIGSNMVKLQKDHYPLETMPQTFIKGWNEETKMNCGGCHGEKGSELDLVSTFIIDGNIVHEAMNEDEGSDYANNDAIFLLHYNYVGIPAVNLRLVGNNTSTYNISLNNENTLKRWVGISSSCISESRVSKYGFLAVQNNWLRTLRFDSSNRVYCDARNIDFLYDSTVTLSGITYNTDGEIVYDTENSLDTDASPGTYTAPECNITYYAPHNFTKFTCQENGEYNFGLTVKNVKENGKIISGDLKYWRRYSVRIQIDVWVDDTYTTLIDTYQLDQDVSGGDGNSSLIIPIMNIQTGMIPLIAGNVVTARIYANTNDDALVNDDTLVFTRIEFQLLEDNLTCQNIIDETGKFKPFITQLKYPLCMDDYLKIKYNKRGHVLLNGQKTWIKQIDYQHNKNSDLILIHKESFCGCN